MIHRYHLQTIVTFQFIMVVFGSMKLVLQQGHQWVLAVSLLKHQVVLVFLEAQLVVSRIQPQQMVELVQAQQVRLVQLQDWLLALMFRLITIDQQILQGQPPPIATLWQATALLGLQSLEGQQEHRQVQALGIHRHLPH